MDCYFAKPCFSICTHDITKLLFILLFLSGFDPSFVYYFVHLGVYFPIHAGLLIAWPFTTFVCLHLHLFSSVIHDSWSSICTLSIKHFGVSLHPQLSSISLNFIRIYMIILNPCSWGVGGRRWPIQRTDVLECVCYEVSNRAKLPRALGHTWATTFRDDYRLCPFGLIF